MSFSQKQLLKEQIDRISTDPVFAARKQKSSMGEKFSEDSSTQVAELSSIDMNRGKPEEARKRFAALLVREPKNYRALLAVADIRQLSGATPGEVTQLLIEAVKIVPGEVAVRLALGIERRGLIFRGRERPAEHGGEDEVAEGSAHHSG